MDKRLKVSVLYTCGLHEWVKGLKFQNYTQMVNRFKM